MSGEPSSWWGTFPVREGAAARWRLGPLTLTIQHLRREWRVFRAVGDLAARDRGVEVDVALHEVQAGEYSARFAAADGVNSVTVMPVLPDLAVVTRPEMPLTVPARGNVSVYVGSPLWLRIIEAGTERVLEDMAALGPRLTWFGPNSMDGEICYASRTFGRLRLEEVQLQPHRVTTAVKILNRAALPLTIESLRLPVPRLSVYATPGADLWTEPLVLERGEGRDLAELRVSSGPPGEAHGATLVAEPRESGGTNMIRAFGSLFS